MVYLLGVPATGHALSLGSQGPEADDVGVSSWHVQAYEEPEDLYNLSPLESTEDQNQGN